jgi:hypothetical protein
MVSQRLIFSSYQYLDDNATSGSSFGNIMWSPDDADLIEFNLFPDDKSHNLASSLSQIRPSLISGAWVKGGSSKLYIVDPCFKSFNKFYEDKIRVSVYEVLKTMSLIEGDLLKASFWNASFQMEKHVYYQTQQLVYNQPRLHNFHPNVF